MATSSVSFYLMHESLNHPFMYFIIYSFLFGEGEVFIVTVSSSRKLILYKHKLGDYREHSGVGRGYLVVVTGVWIAITWYKTNNVQCNVRDVETMRRTMKCATHSARCVAPRCAASSQRTKPLCIICILLLGEFGKLLLVTTYTP